MIFVVYNSQGIPVYSTTLETEAQIVAEMEGGYYVIEFPPDDGSAGY